MDNELVKSITEELYGKYQQSVRELASMMDTTMKQVTVEIDTTDLATLKDGGYSLCFAKKVGDFDYDVIWKSTDKYLVTNEFKWQPIYEIYGTNTFQDSVKVVASTNIQDIGLGEITTLDKYGILSSAVSGGSEDAINVENEYGNIHFAISQMSVNDAGHMESTPIYVSKAPAIVGKSEFRPVEKVQIWFQANAETSTMFAEMRSNPIEVDLTAKNAVSVKYKDGKWAII